MAHANLVGKVALVTGGSKGIGRAIALRFSRDGASVVVNFCGSEAAAQEVKNAIQSAGGQAICVQADVSEVANVERLFNATLEQFGTLDILVNNAGIVVYKPLVETTEEEFDRIFAVNVKGTFFACQQAAKLMSDGGRIVNLSTSATAMMMPNYAAYVGTKGAVELITRILAKELGPKGITVNAVSPGPVDTELFSHGKTEEQKAHLVRLISLGRIGQPDDIADVVALLVSDDAHWITGQNIRANGGTA